MSEPQGEVSIICRICLKTSRLENSIRPMNKEELDFYKSIVPEDPAPNAVMSICYHCSLIMLKYRCFQSECQLTGRYLKLIHNLVAEESDSIQRPEFISTHNFESTKARITSICPEKCCCTVDLNTITFQADASVVADDHFVSCQYDDGGDDDMLVMNSSDDEVPLVLLKDNEQKYLTKDSEKGKHRKVKLRKKTHTFSLPRSKKIQVKKSKVKSKTGMDDIKHGIDYCPQKSNNKYKKPLREGFSSRMVQETDEYLVIKLSKEQVLQEMAEKSKDVRYQRAPYKCDRCVKGFNFEDVLQSHLEKHAMKEGWLECELCGMYCPSKVSLRGHMKSHTTRYKCKVCGEARISRQHLLEHHALTHAAPRTPTTPAGTPTPDAPAYTCGKCPFATDKRTTMQRHARRHGGGGARACHRCGKLFSNMDSLRAHTARHDASKTLQCGQCGRRFVYPSMLHKHVQAVHVNNDYYCVECDVRFKSPENLKLHFLRTKRHRDPASFKHPCPQCESRFFSAASLAGHLSAAHGAARAHACALCRRAYSSGGALRAHARRAHRADRPAGGGGGHLARKLSVAAHSDGAEANHTPKHHKESDENGHCEVIRNISLED